MTPKSPSWWLESHDLLAQRRLERGLPAAEPPLASARRLMFQGGALGVVLLLAVLLSWLWMAWREQQLSATLAQLDHVPASLRSLEGRLRQEQGQLNQLQSRSTALARGLVATSSGSALLTQLAAVTPQGVQLSEVSVSGQSLSLKGLARDPGAFARVNALGLLLSESPLVQPGAVKVVKLSREAPPAAAPAAPGAPGAGAAAPQGPLPLPPVRWELSASLASLSPARQLTVLQGLGADGMARRLQTLAALGLLP